MLYQGENPREGSWLDRNRCRENEVDEAIHRCGDGVTSTIAEEDSPQGVVGDPCYQRRGKTECRFVNLSQK